MSNLKTLFVTTALAMNLANAAAAQSASRPPEGPGAQRRAMVLAMAMQTELELTDEQTLRVRRHLMAIEDENSAFAKTRKDHGEKLRALLDYKGASDKDLLAAIAAARTAREQHDVTVRGLEDKVFSELTPRQQAKYLLFEKRFKEQVRERMGAARENIKERRENRRDARRDGAPTPPAPGAGPD